MGYVTVLASVGAGVENDRCRQTQGRHRVIHRPYLMPVAPQVSRTLQLPEEQG